LPDPAERREILRALLSKIALADEKAELERELASIADCTEGFSGADLSAICERAKFIALRAANYRNDAALGTAHLRTALAQVLQERAHAAAPA
jgi:ATP-dependent 26S proteasome regulatory subunit